MEVVFLSCSIRVSVSKSSFSSIWSQSLPAGWGIEHEFAMFVYSTKRKGCPLKDLKGFSTQQIIDGGDQGYIHLSYKI